MFLRSYKLLSIGLLLFSSSLSFADTQFGRGGRWRIFDTDRVYKWIKQVDYQAETLSDNYDCDGRTASNFKGLFEMGNAFNRLALRSSTKAELGEAKKIPGKIISLGGGQGTILAENGCYRLVATAAHILADYIAPQRVDFPKGPKGDYDHRVAFLKAGATARVPDPSDKDSLKFSTLSGTRDRKTLIAYGIDFRVQSNRGEFNDHSEDQALVVQRKAGSEGKECKGETPKLTKMFDFDNLQNALSEMKEDRTGTSGLMQMCNAKFIVPYKSFCHISEVTIPKDSQKSVSITTAGCFSEEGNSGCPFVYRDPKGEDHFMGTLGGHAEWLHSNYGDKTETNMINFTLFNSPEMQDHYKDLLAKYF